MNSVYLENLGMTLIQNKCWELCRGIIKALIFFFAAAKPLGRTPQSRCARQLPLAREPYRLEDLLQFQAPFIAKT